MDSSQTQAYLQLVKSGIARAFDQCEKYHSGHIPPDAARHLHDLLEVREMLEREKGLPGVPGVPSHTSHTSQKVI